MGVLLDSPKGTISIITESSIASTCSDHKLLEQIYSRTSSGSWQDDTRHSQTLQFEEGRRIQSIIQSKINNGTHCHGLQSTRLLCPWDFPGKSTGVGCHFLLQGIFLTQGSTPGLLHCRQTLYPLSHQGLLR